MNRVSSPDSFFAIFCPDFFSLLCRNHLKLLDALGASPRRWGAPVAIVLYYLFKKMREVSGQVILRHRMRPRPRRGQGWRKGGNHYEIGFLQSTFPKSLSEIKQAVVLKCQKMGVCGTA
jgi:hypothetical protein